MTENDKSTDTRKKKKKTSVVCVVIAAVLIGIQFGLGLITPPKEYYIIYFESNKSDFESIVNQTRDVNGVLYVPGLSGALSSGDACLINVMLFGKFRKVEGNSKRMEFRCRNPYVFPGEPMAIVFNSGKDDDYFNEEVWDEYDPCIHTTVTFKKICDNWYIEYL